MIKITNKNKLLETEKEKIFLFIYPTHFCLGNCLFCYLDTNAKLERKELALSDIRKNIVLLNKKYSITNLVLMGGEPFLWSEINPFLDFMNSGFFKSKLIDLTISTEALQLSSSGLVDHLEKVRSWKKFSLFLQVPINPYRVDRKVIEQRRKAMINMAQRKMSVRYVLFFCKDGESSTKNEADFLRSIYLSYYRGNDSKFCIELRLPFANNFDLFVCSHSKFIKSFLEISKTMINAGIPLLLRNIPLCYLERKDLSFYRNYNFTKSQSMKAAIIRKRGLINPPEIKAYDTSRCNSSLECARCALKDSCNGIYPSYLRKPNYPKLRPF